MTPMRLEVDSGTQTVVAVLTVTNKFKFQDRFAIDCYKGETGSARIDCQSIPESIILSPERSRKVKVRMPVSGDGLYRICSIEDPAEDEDRPVITRICSLVGVGVSPVPSVGSKHRAAADAVAARKRPDSVR